MRTFVIFLAASCLFVATETAQAQGRMLGVKGGVTLASADIENVSGTFDAENRTGWIVGAFLTLGGGVLSVQPEANIVESGFEAPTPLGIADVKLRYFVPAA